MAVCRYMVTCPKWPECRHGGFTARDTLLPGSHRASPGVFPSVHGVSGHTDTGCIPHHGHEVLGTPSAPPSLRRQSGVSTAHATQAFLNDMDDGTPWEAIHDFDVYHAFDSPPKVLISTVLAKMGTPTKLLRLIQMVLEFGATYIRGSPDEVFRTTYGVKPGCPLSFFLFVVVLEIPLRLLQLHGMQFSAFMDDIPSPIAPSHGLRTRPSSKKASP